MSAAEKWVRCLVRTARVVRRPRPRRRPVPASHRQHAAEAGAGGAEQDAVRPAGALPTPKYSHFWVPLTAVVSIEARLMAGVEESSLQRICGCSPSMSAASTAGVWRALSIRRSRVITRSVRPRLSRNGTGGVDEYRDQWP